MKSRTPRTRLTSTAKSMKMAFLTPQFQILSDLHLETPVNAPQYASFRLDVQTDNLFLLGDIGLVVDVGLFQFLRRILEQYRGCRIFYILGNHEAYRTTYEHAYRLLRDFEQEAKDELGGRFRFLCRDRYDVNETISILGCTLWSAIRHDQVSDIASRSTDLSSEHGIQSWSLERHQEEHEKDLTWLNHQISAIEKDEPNRQIIIATHHSPTQDFRANGPRHQSSSVSSNFVTDLSKEACWLSPVVKLWAFGHTHYSCDYFDEATEKLVISNQKGYSGLGAGRGKLRTKTKVVGVEMGSWSVIEGRKTVDEERIRGVVPKTEKPVVHENTKIEPSKPKVSLLDRMAQRISKLRLSRQKDSE